MIARALELQDRRTPDGDEGLSLGDVEDVAAQIGLDPALVRRAAADVRLSVMAEHDVSLTERLLGPRVVLGSTVVPDHPSRVHAAARSWLSADEGLRPIGTRDGAERWTKDKRLLVGLQRGLQVSRATGVLRDIRAVQVRVEPGPDSTLVQLEADTSTIRQTTGGILTAGLVGGVAVGLVSAGVVPDTAAISSDLAQFLVSFGAAATAGAGTALAVGRRWTARVRQAVDEALDGITMTTRQPDLRLPPPAAEGWRATLGRWLGGS